jgi:Na+-transporting NADH:ubiquinone oxidoreductase subunit NqrB
MLDQHAQASTAEIAFYTPTIFAAVYLLFFRHGSPAMPWLLLALYCGGTLTTPLTDEFRRMAGMDEF